jgi:integrase
MAYILAFTALLHISNLAPPTRSAFDPRRHIRRGDITITPNGLSIFIRWTKTLQNYNQTAHIQDFAIPNSQLCPLLAFKSIQHLFSVFPTDPLLSYRVGSNLYYFSQGDLKKALKLTVLCLGLSPKLTFHSFRHSGASLAFAFGVPLQAIQAHGTWASEALWAYIDASARVASIPTLFAQVFSSLP